MARTVRVYRIESDGRRLTAGAFRASSEADLAARWQLFLATAPRGIYLATYRGVHLGRALFTEAGEPVPLAA